LTAAGEQWFDDFVAQDNKRGHGTSPVVGRAIAVRGADPVDQLLAAKFLEIAGCLPRIVAAVPGRVEIGHLPRQIGSCDPLGAVASASEARMAIRILD